MPVASRTRLRMPRRASTPLAIAYFLLCKKTEYRELGANYLDHPEQGQAQERLPQAPGKARISGPATARRIPPGLIFEGGDRNHEGAELYDSPGCRPEADSFGSHKTSGTRSA